MKTLTHVIFAIVALIVSAQAQAGAQELDATDAFASSPDHFLQLQSEFSKSSLPSWDRVTGWYTGRCYTTDAHDTPLNALLVGWTEIVPGEDHGPLFPETKIHKGALLQAPAQPANYFDQMSADAYIETQKFVKDWRDALVPSETYTSSIRIGGTKATTVDLVGASYQFLFLRRMQEGAITQYCYFFSRVGG